MNILGFFQRLGRSLQLPIAVLPVAALMLRFGQPDLLNLAFMAQAGGAIFDNLALIFAIGVASTWSKDNAGSAALAGAVGYFILVKGASVFGDNVTINYIISGNVNDIKTIVLDSSFISKAEELKVGVSSAFGSNGVDIANSIVQSINVAKVNMGVLAGIITGLVGGMSYNRWNDIKLPDFLSFFGGKRFVPIVTGFICLIIAGLLGYVWPPVQVAIRDGGEWIVEQGALGSGIFGFVNRLLIPTGLHQVLNTIAWFQIGDYTDAAGKIFHGDINRFYNGDATAGMFMSGFFPIMMFGLPGAAFAMYFAAKPDRRASVGGLLLSVALTAFLTGVTEPLEFMFMFLAPLLYLVHAVLTGISLYIATALGIHAGFTFSAGAIDYALMYKLPAASNNVWILLVMGLVAFVVYFLLFTVIIRAFNLKTPGREDDSGEALPEAISHTDEGLDALAISYINAIGGSDNLTGIDACITRLRLTVKDSGIVDSNAAKRLGAAGVVKLNKQSIQIIVGAKAESIADSMRKVIASGEAPKVVATALTTAAAVEKETPQVSLIKPVDTDKAFKLSSLVSPMTGDIVDLASVPDEAFASKAVGDGIAIRPTDNLVVSPANGTLVKIFGTNHAFCLETEDGAEVVVHIGIDTVKLNGQGFKRLAEEGATVKTGDPVLELDLEYLTLNAASIISPVVVSNVDDFSGVFDIATGSVIAGQTKLFDIKE